MKYLLALIFCLAIALSILTTIPIILSLALCFAVIFKNSWIFVAAFLGGLFVDILLLRVFGSTSLFLVVFTFMIFLYQRRFEIQTIPFVFLACFIGSFLYLIVFGYNNIFLQALVNAAIGVLLFQFVIPNSFRNLHENRS